MDAGGTRQRQVEGTHKPNLWHSTTSRGQQADKPRLTTSHPHTHTHRRRGVGGCSANDSRTETACPLSSSSLPSPFASSHSETYLYVQQRACRDLLQEQRKDEFRIYYQNRENESVCTHVVNLLHVHEQGFMNRVMLATVTMQSNPGRPCSCPSTPG